MKTKKLLAALLLGALLLSLSGCSSAGTFLSQFFDNVGRRLVIWSGDSGSAAESAEQKDNALPAPENLRIGEDGSFSFDPVEGAESYGIYLYDADRGDGLYSSGAITETSGNLRDYGTYGLADFRAEVIAYPAMGDAEHSKSAPATAAFTVRGEVEEANVGYRWDAFAGTFDVQLVNVEDYLETAFPSKVEVTMTNEADPGDVVTLRFENVSLANDVFYTGTTEVSPDATYQLRAVVDFPAAVTNNHQELDLGSVTTAGDVSAISDGFAYKITDVYSFADFPTAATFDPAQGGSIGIWYYYRAYSVNDKGLATPASLTGDNVYYTASPVSSVTPGSAYSFTVRMSGENGVIASASSEMQPGMGTLELKEDGTFLLSITGSEPEDTGSDDASGEADASAEAGSADSGSSEMGSSEMNLGVSAAQVSGTWKENEDGTVSLSYDLSTAALTA